jgi:hypothetical protein
MDERHDEGFVSESDVRLGPGRGAVAMAGADTAGATRLLLCHERLDDDEALGAGGDDGNADDEEEEADLAALSPGPLPARRPSGECSGRTPPAPSRQSATAPSFSIFCPIDGDGHGHGDATRSPTPPPPPLPSPFAATVSALAAAAKWPLPTAVRRGLGRGALALSVADAVCPRVPPQFKYWGHALMS